LRDAAAGIADNVELLSGHGGPCFVYDPRLQEGAFDAIYALSRRYWGVDVESLNGTLPLSASGIKGVNWITMVGNAWVSEPKFATGIAGLHGVPNVSVEQKRHGVVLTAGPAPVAGDQNFPDPSLDPYFAVGQALAPLHLSKHPDFPGEAFIRNRNTVGWIRRFVDPAGWR